jgi:hypothetical protein
VRVKENMGAQLNIFLFKNVVNERGGRCRRELSLILEEIMN